LLCPGKVFLSCERRPKVVESPSCAVLLAFTCCSPWPVAFAKYGYLRCSRTPVCFFLCCETCEEVAVDVEETLEDISLWLEEQSDKAIHTFVSSPNPENKD